MPSSSVSEHRIPVIVGVGEIVDRPKEITAGLEPLTLLEQSLQRAEADAGAKLLAEIDSLDIVNFLSWRYHDPAKQLSQRLGIQPRHAYYGPVGGESPIRYLHEAAQRISASRAANAAWPRSAAPRRNRPRPRPNAPASRCHGRRSPMTSRSRSAARRSRSRLIAWPYTKLMVANPTVNMGGAVLLTSLAKARAAGIPEDRLIHIHGGASAEEPRDYLARDRFFESHAQNAVLKAVMALAGDSGKAFDAIELYSCFPCVPKMARRTLGLDADVQPTVTGGLTFFGAPLNTYMTHAACAMVRKLRSGAQLGLPKLGLLYGQGGFVTKHHALVLSRQAPKQTLSQHTSLQAEADRHRGAVPEFATEASGKGKVESFTVIYGRGGEVEHGVVMLRTSSDARTLARIPASDSATLAHLLNMDRTPVGSTGDIVTAGDDVLEWRVG
jgi:acetyl-CoA C-acetyltransferase